MIFSEYQNFSFYGPHYDSFEGFNASFPVHCKWMENIKKKKFPQRNESHIWLILLLFLTIVIGNLNGVVTNITNAVFATHPIIIFLIIINIACFHFLHGFSLLTPSFFLLLHLSSSSSSVTALVPSPLLSFCFLQQCSSIVVSHSAAALADGHVIKNCLTTLRQQGSRAATHSFTLLLHRKRTHISASQNACTPIQV